MIQTSAPFLITLVVSLPESSEPGSLDEAEELMKMGVVFTSKAGMDPYSP